MSRDLLTDPYGRFYYLPQGLAARGHDVSVFLLDYENGPRESTSRSGLRQVSCPPRQYLREVGNQVRGQRPDWIIGLSDTWYGILASRLAGRFSTRCAIDAYDNYESYMGWAKPLHWMWRRALGRADLLTAAGPALLELMAKGNPTARGAVVPMAADPVGFEPRERDDCRRELGLPATGHLVGYCGSMHRSRGVDVLFGAIPLVHAERPDVGFLHSGRTWKDTPLPESIRSFGYIETAQVPLLINSVDVLAVLNRASAFGEHSYPVKLYEAMSCNVPVVATRTRATEWILRDTPECLVPPDSPAALAASILDRLDRGAVRYVAVPTWTTSCDILERALLEA